MKDKTLSTVLAFRLDEETKQKMINVENELNIRISISKICRKAIEDEINNKYALLKLQKGN